MRVLVLGATGFIGTRVVDDLVLRRGDQVRVTVRDYRKAVRLGRLPVEWVEASASDAARMRQAAHGCDAVVCCAHPFSSPREADAALEICHASAAAAAATTTRRLVFLSSTMIYGLHGGPGSVVDDDTVPKPDTPYGSIKLQCETLLGREHDAGAIRLVVLRPSIVYGPFSPSWTMLPARQMQSGELVLPRAAAGACNAVYVDDLAQAIGAAVGVESSARLATNVSGADRPGWREFYACYEPFVRAGSVSEWSVEAIQAAAGARERERGGLSALKRAIRDQAVRDRLNEIPVLSRLNQIGKSFGWGGLPPVAAGGLPSAAAPRQPLIQHLPTSMLLDLYLRAPRVDGSRAAQLLGVTPRDLQAGMKPTLDWLRWAGLAAGDGAAA